MQKKLFFLLCVIFFISVTRAQTADFYYCGDSLDYQTVGFWTTDNNSYYAAYQAVVYQVDITNTYTIAGPFTYTYATYEGGAGGPGMGNMTQLRPDKDYRIYYQVKANISDPWSAPGTPCTFTTANVEYLYDCGAGALNIDANGVVASDYNGLYQYYRFEFSVDNTFSEHTVIGSPISNKFSIELDPTNKSPSNALAYNTATGLQYSHVYYGRVRVRMDPSDPWSNAGPACTFTTYCPGTSIPPVYYYQFENSQYDGAGTVCYSGNYANYAEVMGTSRLLRTASAIAPQPGQVGTCRQEYLTNNINSSYLYTCGGTCSSCALNCIWGCTDPSMDMTTTSALTIEFLLKPDNSKGNSWQFVTNFGSASKPYIAISPGNFIFEITDPTNTTVTSYINTAFVPSYPGLFSENYFNDGNWHHLVCVYDGNASPPQMQIWVDSQLIPDLTTTVNVPSSITFPDSFTSGGSPSVPDVNYNGFWDELAVYNQALPPGMIYQHYKDMQAGNHYNLCTSLTSSDVPASPTPSCPALGSNEYSPTSIDPDQQLYSFPLPRYMPGHGLKPNFPYTDIRFMATIPSPGNLFPPPTKSVLLNVNQERAINWNYYLEANAANNDIQNFNSYASPNDYLGSDWMSQLNSLTNYPVSTIIYDNWSLDYVPLGTLTDAANSSTVSGDMEKHGDTLAMMTNTNLGQYLTRPIDIINLDEETYSTENLVNPLDATVTGPLQYSLVTSFKNGLLDGSNYTNSSIVSGTKFTKYRIGGFVDNNQIYPYTIPSTEWNYSTLDIYTSPTHWLGGNPGSLGLTAFETARSQELSIASTNYNLCSPFVSANYNPDESANMKPSQYLALLKAYGIMGADFYYVGYFNQTSPACAGYAPATISTPATCTSVTSAWPNATYDYSGPIAIVTDPGGPNDPRTYMYQLAMPSYAQAVTSRYEDLLRNSSLLGGLNALYYTNIKYRFTVGDEVVYVRKSNKYTPSTNVLNEMYVINGSMMIDNNCDGFEPEEKKQTINLSGYGGPSGDELTFNIRRQGSTYIYDRRNSSNVLFYQLDKWHEVTHPYYWSTDFKFEAEVFDTPGSSNNVELKTETPVTASANDYTDFTTFTRYPSGSTTTTSYLFEPRDQTNSANTTQYYVWVRARRNSDVSTPSGHSSLNLTVVRESNTNPNTVNPARTTTVLNQSTIPCIDNSGFKWYSFGFTGSNTNPSQTLQFTGTATHMHEIIFTANDPYLEFDQFILSTSSSTPAGVTASDVAVYCGSNLRPVGIETNSANEVGCKIYPSPNTGDFLVATDSKSEQIQSISVINIIGEEIFKAENVNDNSYKVSISNMRYNGVVFALVRTNNGIYKRKIVIVK